MVKATETTTLRSFDTKQQWISPPRELHLSPDTIDVWRASLGVSAEEEAALGRFLSEDERERARQIQVVEKRREFIVARGILRDILGRYLRQDPSTLKIGRGSKGKPFLLRGEATPDLRFNLSHSRELSLYAVSLAHNVGIDVEQVRSEWAGDDVARRFFSEKEIQSLSRLPVERRLAGFFRCWTSKEAFVKARGDGLGYPLDTFEVEVTPDAPAALISARGHPDEPSRWILQALDVGVGHASVCAVEGVPSEWRLWVWTPGWAFAS